MATSDAAKVGPEAETIDALEIVFRATADEPAVTG